MSQRVASLVSDTRRRLILERLELDGEVGVEEMADACGVSHVTMRSDFNRLAEGGLVLRTRGGVRAAPGSRAQDRAAAYAEKARIGQAAATLIGDGETILLDGGSTTLEIAKRIPTDMRLTVITGSIAIVNELLTRPRVELHVLGGQFDHTEGTVLGATAEAQVAQFLAHKVFLGACGIDADFDVVDTSNSVAKYKRALLTGARHRILVADSTKWGLSAQSKTLALAEFETVITDSQIPMHYSHHLTGHAVDLVTV